jgi:hypothetical protein
MKEAIARQAGELVANRRRNEELGGRVQQLEEENRRLHDSSEGLKDQLGRVEAGQQSDIARLQEEIAAGGSKVKEDLENVQRDVAKLKEDMIVTRRMTGKELFAPSMKKGEYFDAPDGIIAHLTRECGGNVRDRHVAGVTSGSFAEETWGGLGAAKNAADLEAVSYFHSAYRMKKEDIPHTRNN